MSPFEWRGKKPSINVKDQDNMTRWLISTNKNPDAVKPQRTFTEKGKVLAEQRNSK